MRGPGNKRDKNKHGKFNPRAFFRVARTVLPHRGLLFVGVATSILYAALHSVSILGALPVLKLLLEEEGLHGWVDRSVAGLRIDATLVVQETPDDVERPLSLELQKVDSDSALYAAGVRDDAKIVTLNGERLAPRVWLRTVAHAPTGEEVTIGVVDDRTREPVEHSITLNEPSWEWRLGGSLVALIPRDKSSDDRLTALFYILITLVVVVVVANVARFASEYFLSLAVLRAMMDLRRQLYSKVLSLPMTHFTRDVGDIVSRFVQDIQDVQRGIMTLFGKTIREPLKGIFLLVCALALDWRITVTMAIAMPLAILVFWSVGARIKKAARKLLKGYGYMVGTLTDTFGAIAVVKAYTSENAERRRLWQIDRKMFKQQSKLVRLDAAVSPSLEVLGVAMISGAAYWLGGRVIGHEMDPAKFGQIVVLLGMMTDPIRKLADVYTRVIRSSAGADRLYEILDAKDETQLSDGTETLGPIESKIEWCDVTFSYPEADSPALDHISLCVNRGETIALVGPNGSGKTTLVNMLSRFYDPQQGVVKIDGTDLRTVTLKSLRRQIGLVTQDAVVFPISLADNIAYGTRNGSRELVIAAARRAFADEFIREKPDGYDTVPGEMGKTLSGGQRQRIAIARAMYRDAPVLIFDEATSQVDSESEKKIQTAVREFSEGRTTFIIAHRMATIRFADRIIVMDGGRIIDQGTHDELFARCKLYHGLCETQLMQ
jgi:ATP-binding cassette, subfamily B, bacterial MsbA